MKNPAKNDWTKQVKDDLNLFKIEPDLKQIAGKSQNVFKKFVKVKAAEYEFRRLMNLKQKHSKMDNLNYSKLELQGYLKLKSFNSSRAKTLFSHRTRMAKYGENYRMNGNPVSCPLCSLHLNNQEMSFNNCPVIKSNLEVKGCYQDIFKNAIPLEVVKSLESIEVFREETIKSIS